MRLCCCFSRTTTPSILGNYLMFGLWDLQVTPQYYSRRKADIIETKSVVAWVIGLLKYFIRRKPTQIAPSPPCPCPCPSLPPPLLHSSPFTSSPFSVPFPLIVSVCIILPLWHSLTSFWSQYDPHEKSGPLWLPLKFWSYFPGLLYFFAFKGLSWLLCRWNPKYSTKGSYPFGTQWRMPEKIPRLRYNQADDLCRLQRRRDRCL